MESRPSDALAHAPWFLTVPPQTPRGITPRPRLVTRLGSALSETGVVVVAAPSGYGKTVLMSAFAQEHAACWLTLTHHERDDELLILRGILSSLERAAFERVMMHQAPFTTSLMALGRATQARDLYGRIAHTVAATASDLILMIDDAHHAGAMLGDIVEVLRALTDGRMRIVLGGLPDTASGSAKWIAASAAQVLTAAELTMSIDDLIEDAAHAGDGIDRATAAEQVRACGGWPIAHRLNRMAAPTDHAAAARAGSLFVDFVESRVLGALSVQTRAFVLATTTCSRLDEVLAEALDSSPDPGALIEDCLHAGLPLERILDGDDRIVYRWQDVFAEACRTIVRRTSLAHSRELNTRAAHVLADRFPAEALRHAALAEDAPLALSIVRASWLRILLESGATSLEHSCSVFDAEFGDHPEVLAIMACCANMAGDRIRATAMATRAEALTQNEPNVSLTLTFAKLFVSDERPALMEATDRALASLTSDASEPATHAYRTFVVGWTLLRLRHRPADAIRLLRASVADARRLGRPVLERRAASNLLFALSLSGRFDDARNLIDDSLVRDAIEDDWTYYDGGIGLFALGFTAYWQGRFDQAEETLRTLSDRDGHDESYAALGRVYLAFLAAQNGDPVRVREAQARLTGISRNEAHGLPWPAYRTIATAALLSARGHTTEALEAIAPLLDEAHIPIVRIVAADIARRAGEPGLAMSFLSGLTEVERSAAHVGASTATTAALVAYERGDSARAHLRIEQALDLAASEGVVVPFCSPDPLLRELLAAHAVAGSRHADFIAERLVVLEAGRHAPGTSLSDREREILGYLRTSMTAQEIAAAQFISVNTVRTHIRAIYRKLGVTNRRDAVRTPL